MALDVEKSMLQYQLACVAVTQVLNETRFAMQEKS